MTAEPRDWPASLRDGQTRDAASAELRDSLRRILARSFGRRFPDADLDDLAQESMLRVHDKLDSYAGRSAFTTWAASIAVNTALSELRRRKYQSVSLEDAIAIGEASIAPAGPEGVARQQAETLLTEAIDAALTDRQKTALLAELGGLPLMEIARRLGKSRGSIYKLLHDARAKLRKHFEARGLSASDLFGPKGHHAAR